MTAINWRTNLKLTDFQRAILMTLADEPSTICTTGNLGIEGDFAPVCAVLFTDYLGMQLAIDPAFIVTLKHCRYLKIKNSRPTSFIRYYALSDDGYAFVQSLKDGQ